MGTAGRQFQSLSSGSGSLSVLGEFGDQVSLVWEGVPLFLILLPSVSLEHFFL